uniref:Uncharacterized protein n=1 Tax=Prolemur simus TaxID=1328070 RepID=A0A8C9DRU0_PROSS
MNTFFFLLEMGFYYDVQAVLQLLGSSHPPTLTSRVAGITGESHHAWQFMIKVFITII